MKKAILLLAVLLLASCSPKEPLFEESNPGESCTLPDDAAIVIEEKTPPEENAKEEFSIFLFPENEYDMSPEAFLHGENNDYLCYVFGMTDCIRKTVPFEKLADFRGFSSPDEIESEALFNIFMYVFDEAKNSSKGDLSAARWLESDGLYHIPIADIEKILGKYFDEFCFDMEKSGADFYYDENGAAVISGGYGKGGPLSSISQSLSVTDNDDGTFTASATESVFKTDSFYGSYEQPVRDLSLVFRLEENRFILLEFESISLS